jgi:hypothetical protein
MFSAVSLQEHFHHRLKGLFLEKITKIGPNQFGEAFHCVCEMLDHINQVRICLAKMDAPGKMLVDLEEFLSKEFSARVN